MSFYLNEVRATPILPFNDSLIKFGCNLDASSYQEKFDYTK